MDERGEVLSGSAVAWSMPPLAPTDVIRDGIAFPVWFVFESLRTQDSIPAMTEIQRGKRSRFVRGTISPDARLKLDDGTIQPMMS